MTREEDFAVAYANLKGPRDKDYIGTARALQRLKSYPEYRTNERLAEHLPVSREIVREFLALLKLPKDIQRLFGPQGLKLEHGRRLWQLTRRRPELQRGVAAAMNGLTAHDARHLVEYVLDHPDIPAAEARQQVLDSKTRITREYHVIALLSETQYSKLRLEARRRKKPIDELVSSIVNDWLATRSRADG